MKTGGVGFKHGINVVGFFLFQKELLIFVLVFFVFIKKLVES